MEEIRKELANITVSVEDLFSCKITELESNIKKIVTELMGLHEIVDERLEEIEDKSVIIRETI